MTKYSMETPLDFCHSERELDLLKAEVVQDMFDKALETNNRDRLSRILGAYSVDYLDTVLAGYPWHLTETIEEEK